MGKKLTTSVALTKEFEIKVLQKVIADGYGMKGKSRWIVEAIESFLERENFPELVEIASEIENLNSIVSIRIPENVLNKIREAIVLVREEYPSLEGVQSNIIRASIVQRLILSE